MTYEPTIYLSASMTRRAEINGYARELTALGDRVMSTWHNGDEATNDDTLTDAECWTIANRDMIELDRSDHLILFGDPVGEYAGRGGKWVEMGIALALEATVTIIGHRENVFARMPGIGHYPTFADYLAKRKADQ